MNENSGNYFTNLNPVITDALKALDIPLYHDNAPENGIYPILQYQTISETPALQADNKTIAREVIIRVTLIDKTPANREAIKNSIIEIMEGIGFMWQNTNTVRDKNEYYTAIDFSVGEERDYV